MIAIVGGGISGLAAAYELATRQVPFVLFEAGDRVGGLIHTIRRGGFTIEGGADSLLVQKRAGLELCDELGLTSRLITMQPPRTAFVLYRGRLHALPPRSTFGIPSRWKDLARYSLLSAGARARLALEPVVPRRRDRAADESIAQFFRRRLGPATLDTLAHPLLGGIHAGDIEALSLPALFPRLAEVERSGRSVLRWVRSTARGAASGGAFRSLAAGMGELVDAITRRLPLDAIRYRTPALSLARAPEGWNVATSAGAGRFDAVILACPAHVASDLLAPVDPAAAAVCAQVRYVSTVSLALGWPRSAVRHPLDGSGFVVARGSHVRINACTWVSSKWEGRAPAGYVLLRAYLGGVTDSAAVDLPDEELTSIATRELSAILSIAGAPVISQITRWRDAGAQHEVGHLQRMKSLEERLGALRHLFVAGSGFRAIGVPDCIADGRAVAVMAARSMMSGA